LKIENKPAILEHLFITTFVKSKVGMSLSKTSNANLSISRVQKPNPDHSFA
jgi:hypothetical protein